MIAPPIWSRERIAEASARAQEHFRQGRHTEPLDVYLDLFDEYQGIVEEVLERTVDLTRMRDALPDLLDDPRRREALRYLSGPPVSLDDLKVLVQLKSLAAKRVAADPDAPERLLGFVRDWHDRRRFPWVLERRAPDEAERAAAVLATAALLAMRRTETLRRTRSSAMQEQLVAGQLRRSGFGQVETRKVATLRDAPEPGRFCRESMLGSRKADFIIGLRDGRTMALECKVSNSSTNSIKRLNNDAAVKAETWRREFGTEQVVTAAVLDGVYAPQNLVAAQEKGLTIFWAHDLHAMFRWMRDTGARADEGAEP